MRPKHLLCLMAFLCGCTTLLILFSPLFAVPSLILQLAMLLLALKILQDSQTDTLTGASNLRKLSNLLNYYHHAKELTVIYLDVNDLKQLNDHKGHDSGNQALKEIAAFMLQVAGDAAQVYRIGGDEFILISVGSKSSDLIQLWNTKIDGLHHVGFSYGIATGAGKALESLIGDAEQQMYIMKQGHNKSS